MKSAPELWELADDLRRLEAWTGGLVGNGEPVRVEVTDRKPGEILAWKTSGTGSSARMALELAESGFGTSVQVTAHHESHSPSSPAALERLLDELGSPDRRPFVGN